MSPSHLASVHRLLHMGSSNVDLETDRVHDNAWTSKHTSCHLTTKCKVKNLNSFPPGHLHLK